MPNILIDNNFYQGTSQACIIDLTPPTFAGINFLDVESRGQIRAGWSAATDSTPPIRYEVYVQASTATGLFNVNNIVAVTPHLQYDIFTLPDGSFLQNGTTYYVGVRAIDGVNNRDSNLVSMSVISTGILTAIDTYECDASYSVDTSNNFRVTAWANKNGNLANAPGAILGTASYQVYDKLGAPFVGMSGSGVSPDSEGMFVFPAVADLIPETQRHAVIKVTISVDGENRVNNVGIRDTYHDHDMGGVASLNSNNDLVGSFWVSKNTEIMTTNLGLGSYQAYDASGNPLVGFSETGIVPDVNGFYSITPLPLPPTIDTTQAYSVRISAIVDNQVRSAVVVLNAGTTAYTCRSTFSINALNQLEATFWATENDELVDTAILGTASYQIYDKNGVAVVGLTQSGIAADGQGLFHTTPVNAALLTDLTHYTARITIVVAGQSRTVMKGFTLLGN